jgi:hypothetical protein
MGPFGDRTLSKPEDTVAENIKGTFPNTEMERWALEQAEDVYDRCVCAFWSGLLRSKNKNNNK